QPAAGMLDLGDCQLDRHGRAIRLCDLEFSSSAKRPLCAPVLELSHEVGEAAPPLGRDQRLGNPAADDGAARVAEYTLRRRIEIKNGPRLIDDDNAVGGGVEHSEPCGFAHDEARRRQLDCIADQITERSQHRFLGKGPLALLDAVVKPDMPPPHAVDPDGERDERFDLLVFEVLTQIPGKFAGVGLDYLAAPAAGGPVLPYWIVVLDTLLDIAPIAGERREARRRPVALAGLPQAAILELMDLIEVHSRDAEALPHLRHDSPDMLAPIARGTETHCGISDEKGGVGDIGFLRHQPLLTSAVTNM